ncbi:MAG: hypothetical protein WC371_01325 [Parachlamydiales bacterium]|jgi:hypothetical protein
MQPIKVEVFTKAPAKRVYQAWVEMYQAKTSGNFKEGYKGYITEMGRKMPFEIKEVKKNEGFTIIWSSFVVRIIFKYAVEQAEKGSKISCRVRFGGLFGFAVRLFLKKKMIKNLTEMLSSFADQLSLVQKGARIRSF